MRMVNGTFWQASSLLHISYGSIFNQSAYNYWSGTALEQEA